VTSAGVGPIANVNDAPTGSVLINNATPAEGDTLTASNTLADADGLSGPISYQWYRDGVAIAGATGSNYTTMQTDVGAVIMVEASYTDDQGTSVNVRSTGTAPAMQANDAYINTASDSPDARKFFLFDQATTSDLITTTDKNRDPDTKEPDLDFEKSSVKATNNADASLQKHHLKYIVIPTEYDYGDSDESVTDDSFIRRTAEKIRQMADYTSDFTSDMLQMFDLMRIKISEPDSSANSFMSQSVPAIMLSLSAGLVTWALRGGALLASMVSAIPVWKGFDPLPIIAASRKRREENKGISPEDVIYSEQVDGLFDDGVIDTDAESTGNTTDS
jgi:hypothetical protein